MNRITKLVSWVLLPLAAAGCSDNSDTTDTTAIELSHAVIVTGIEVENIDNGQPVPVDGKLIDGQVQIE